MGTWLETSLTVAISVHLSILLASAGLQKAARPTRFATDLYKHRVVPGWAQPLVVRAFPKLEIAIALLLFTGVYPRAGLLAAIFLFAVFALYQLVLLALGRDVNCGCYGHRSFDKNDRLASITASGINLALAVIALACCHAGFSYPFKLSSMLAAIFTVFIVSVMIIPRASAANQTLP